jgi:hypothetical protein
MGRVLRLVLPVWHALFGAQKIIRYLRMGGSGQKAAPVVRAAREDDITGDRVFADKDFLRVKPVGSWQAHGLAATIDEQFGGLGHDLTSMVRW